eukprot:INCI17309.6.p1 GENE.INCI17309.6~~INCI17309.6.p1  ORF type:complete len:337 (+),score=59.68 INCI17309.6:165-1175(+)
MMQKIKAAFRPKGTPKQAEEVPAAKRKKVNVLVIDGDVKHKWAEIFAQATPDVEVVQTAWRDVSLSAYSTCFGKPGAICSLPKQRRTFRADFVLVREEVRGVGSGSDWRNVLYGLMFAGVPSVNSLESIIMFGERPLAYGRLLQIRKELGPEKFPLIEQSYYSDFREMIIGPNFPAVVKVGHGQAGYGKMKLNDHHQFEDFKTVMAMTDNYCTAEEFLVGDYDLRIQKIGNQYRAFKRTAMGGQWKTNTGTSVVEAIPMTPQYKLWADACAKSFGGLEIVTVDALHRAEDGTEFILEMNGTSSGVFGRVFKANAPVPGRDCHTSQTANCMNQLHKP